MNEPRPQSILLVDDSQEIHDLVEARLQPEGVAIHHALDAETGYDAMRRLRPDVLLLDLELPGHDGLSLCRDVKADPELAATMVIFLTGNVDVETKVKAFDVGATDYVTKPFDAVELRARVRAALRTRRYLDLLATRAQLDGLTGLWNRARFDEALAEDFSLWQRERRSASLLMIDIDRFKQINDTYGHPFGDLVLRRVADTIRSDLRQSETSFRYGGEEFAVMLRGVDLRGAESAAQRLRGAIAGLQLAHGQTTVEVTASFGVASFDRPGVFQAADLVVLADRALYAAKRAGRNQVCTAADG